MRRKKYTCSQFVASVLLETKEIDIPVSPAVAKPIHFMNIEGIKCIYEGVLDRCDFPIDDKSGFYSEISA